jgi:hypothetical protein
MSVTKQMYGNPHWAQVEPVGGALVGMKGWRKYHGIRRKCGRISVLKRAAARGYCSLIRALWESDHSLSLEGGFLLSSMYFN